MKIKFGRIVHYFYFINFLILAIGLTYGIKFYWQQGTVNFDNTGSVFEASLKVNELKNRNDVSDLKDLVESDKTLEAEKVMSAFEKKIKQLEDAGKLKSEFSDLLKSITQTKESLHSLVVFQERSSILYSLESKIKQFESFVIENKWRTLTRMIGRIKAQIDPSQARKAGFFNYQKILELSKSLNRDISVMVSVTDGSVLSRQNKDLIIVKINTFKVEIIQLEKYLDLLKNFTGNQEQLQLNYKTWLKAMGPQIALKKMEMENNSRRVLMSMIVLVLFMTFAMVVGFLIYSWSQKRNQKTLEKFCLDLIRDGLLPQENKMKDYFSESFSLEFERLRHGLHNRMSFGAVFQEAMPFPALLFDSNLNLVWGNSLFFQDWKLNKSDSLSWDFIRRLTNVSENDPVQMALQKGFSGIYQIEMKNHTEAAAVVYEMFVSAVDVQNQRKIMIICYPLKAVHDSLLQQRDEFKEFVTKILDAIKLGKFNNQFADEMKQTYQNLNLLDLCERFVGLNEKQISEIKFLENEINALESEMSKLNESYKQALSLHEERSLRVGSVVKKFEGMKNGFVKTIDERNIVDELRLNTAVTAKNLIKSQRNLIEEARRLESTVNESLKTFRNTSALRTEFSGLKGTINDFRTRIMELLDQLMVWDRAKNLDPHRMAEALTRVRMEMKGFEKNLSSLGILTVNLDVVLGKIQFILESYKNPNLIAHKELVDEAEVVVESDVVAGDKIMRSSLENEQEMIYHLTEIYKILKDDHKDTRHLGNENRSQNYLPAQ